MCQLVSHEPLQHNNEPVPCSEHPSPIYVNTIQDSTEHAQYKTGCGYGDKWTGAYLN